MVDFLDEQGRFKVQVLKGLADKGALRKVFDHASLENQSQLYDAYKKTGWVGILKAMVQRLQDHRRGSDRERGQIAEAIPEIMGFSMARFRLGRCNFENAYQFEPGERGWTRNRGATASTVPDLFAHLYISRDAGTRAKWCSKHTTAARQWDLRQRRKRSKQSRRYIPNAKLPRGV